MKTYPMRDEKGVYAFETEMIEASARTLAQLISGVEGVSGVSIRRPFSRTSYLAKFDYAGCRFVIVEPFNDNSRFWIGPLDDSSRADLQPIEESLRGYEPPGLRGLLSSVVRFGSVKRS